MSSATHNNEHGARADEPRPGPSQRQALLAALLVLGTLLLYVPVVHHHFISGWDDDIYITENNHVISGLKLANLKWAFTSMEPFYWHPVTWLSHMVDCQLFGLNSGAHHFANVLLHAVNVLLLFLLLNRATGALWRSFLVAALFAVHPMNVETVAWAAERKSLLSAFFSLLTVAAYGWYLDQPSWKKYVAVLAAFCLSLMSKPVAVTLPVVLLLLDYWPLNRSVPVPSTRRWLRSVVEKLPLVIVGLGICAITVVSERAAGVIPPTILPVSTRIENAVLSYVAYIGTALWPANLSVFYPHPSMRFGLSLAMDRVIPSAAILVGITVLVLYSHRNRYLVFGWSLFVITLLPLIGLIPTGFMGRADHFTYIPCIGLFIILVWGSAAIFESLQVPRAVPILCAVSLIAGYSAATAHYLPFWENGVRLFGQASIAAPDSWTELLYGNALLSNGQADEALEHYRKSCAMYPRNEYCHYQIAGILFSRHQLRNAIDEYQFTLMFTRRREIELDCLNKSGEALAQLGEYDAAERSFVEALSIDSGNATALRLREQTLAKKNGSR